MTKSGYEGDGVYDLDSADEAAVLDALEGVHRALRHGNVAALSDLLADDVVYVHSTGRAETKQEFLSSPYTRTAYNYQYRDAVVRGSKDLAVVNATVEIPGLLLTVATFVWHRRADRWLLIARQSTQASGK